MNKFEIRKAERRKVKLRVVLMGPSGGGKTYSALRLAAGIGGKTCLIDTEQGRGDYYAGEFEYDVLPLAEPFTPERYIEAIEAVEAGGYDTVVIDSASHEWAGKGGLLEIHGNMPGNSYTNWNKITPRHNAFLDKFQRCACHVIATVRGKDQYVLGENEKGKQEPRKVGLGAVQRDGIEYEYTCSFMLDVARNVAQVMKDNTHIFDVFCDRLTEEHGKALLAWATSGMEAPPPKNGPPADSIKQKFTALKDTGILTDKHIHQMSADYKALMAEDAEMHRFEALYKRWEGIAKREKAALDAAAEAGIADSDEEKQEEDV